VYFEAICADHMLLLYVALFLFLIKQYPHLSYLPKSEVLFLLIFKHRKVEWNIYCMQLKMLTRDGHHIYGDLISHDNHSELLFIGELLFTRFTYCITFVLLEVIHMHMHVCILV
jgi:hypothetical protein